MTVSTRGKGSVLCGRKERFWEARRHLGEIKGADNRLKSSALDQPNDSAPSCVSGLMDMRRNFVSPELPDLHVEENWIITVNVKITLKHDVLCGDTSQNAQTNDGHLF